MIKFCLKIRDIIYILFGIFQFTALNIIIIIIIII